MSDEMIATGFGEPNTSYWLDAVPTRLRAAAPPREIGGAYDVAIIGGGLSGLWTAWYLHKADPSLKIGVFEAQHIAFGASGRNGGWVLGLLDHQAKLLSGCTDAVKSQARSIIASTVDEVGCVVTDHEIDCGFHKGGMLRIAARHAYQLDSLEKYKRQMKAEGGEACFTPLNAAEAAKQVAMRDVIAGAFYPQCAVINPAALAYGLAALLRDRGVDVHEGARVRALSTNCLQTNRGACHADRFVIATEGYTSTLPGLKDRIIGVYSHVLATEPLAPALRKTLAIADRQAFSDTSGSGTYGQITMDDRLVFGALGDYPRSGSAGGMTDRRLARQHHRLQRIMVDIFPSLQSVRIAKAWSGVLGVARRSCPKVIETNDRRLLFLGGYSGRGVAASNLFGRTAADMICARDSFLARAPWTQRADQITDVLTPWEPEPLRSLGFHAALMPGAIKDRIAMSRAPSVVRRAGISLLSAIHH